MSPSGPLKNGCFVDGSPRRSPAAFGLAKLSRIRSTLEPYTESIVPLVLAAIIGVRMFAATWRFHE